MTSNDKDRDHSSLSLNRRAVLSGGTALVTSGLAGCTSIFGSGASDESGDRTKVHSMALEGSMFVPVFLYGIDNDIWADRGIDLSLEVTGFGEFTRTFSQNLATGMSPLSSLPLAENLSGDTPVKCFGQTLNFINQCFVPKGSDIQKPTDLKGRTLGVPGRGSSTTRYYVAMWDELYGFDILNDTGNIVDASSSVLYNFLSEGKEVDAALLFTGQTIKALGNTEIRSIFNPIKTWTKKHGYPPSVTLFGVYDDFLNKQPKTVLNYWQGWVEAVKLFRNEFDQAIKKHGASVGIDLSSGNEKQVVHDLTTNEQLFPTEWTAEWVQMNINLFKLVAQHGGIKTAPNADQFLTTQELEDKS